MALSTLGNTRIGVALAAACAVLAASPGEARASHESLGSAGLFAMTLAHTQLVPAYLSTGYYLYASKDPMPPAWTVMNVITGVAAGSVGVAMMAASASAGDVDHGPRNENSTEIVTGFFGGVTLATGLTVSVLSIMLATRPPGGAVEKGGPKKAPPKEAEKVKWSFLVVPSAGIARDGAPSGGLTLVGSF